jgi:1-acyl-sn-glycerol-3-phosphate acyltransferase
MKPYFIAPLFLQKLIWMPTRFTLWFFGHLKVEGLENIATVKGNVIFASNHSSEIDPFLVPSSLPFFSRFSPLFYATREKAFYDVNGWRKHLFGGLFINAWGGYGVKVGLNDYAKSLEEHIRILEDGASFCIFPEGGITRDGKLQPGKGGIAYMAEQGKVPVVPVAFTGQYRTKAADFFLRRKHIVVRFGRPIYQAELKEAIRRDSGTVMGVEVYKREAQYVMDKIGEMLY